MTSFVLFHNERGVLLRLKVNVVEKSDNKHRKQTNRVSDKYWLFSIVRVVLTPKLLSISQGLVFLPDFSNRVFAENSKFLVQFESSLGLKALRLCHVFAEKCSFSLFWSTKDLSKMWHINRRNNMLPKKSCSTFFHLLRGQTVVMITLGSLATVRNVFHCQKSIGNATKIQMAVSVLDWFLVPLNSPKTSKNSRVPSRIQSFCPTTLEKFLGLWHLVEETAKKTLVCVIVWTTPVSLYWAPFSLPRAKYWQVQKREVFSSQKLCCLSCHSQNFLEKTS